MKGWFYLMDANLGVVTGLLLFAVIVIISRPITGWLNKMIDKLFQD